LPEDGTPNDASPGGKQPLSLEQLRESEALFRQITDYAPIALWVSDPSGACTYLNRGWYRFTGQTPETGFGFGWLDAIHPDDRQYVQESFVAAAKHRHETYRVEYRLRWANGTYRWVTDSAAPRFADDGTYLGYIGSVLDIDDQRKAEEQQKVLVAELQHRTRNLLGVVQVIASQTLKDSAALRRYEERLRALGRVQSFLGRGGDGVELDELVRAELAAFPQADRKRIAIKGPPVLLPTTAVQALALALHELATNAIKYGALASPVGRLAISWRLEERDGQRHLHLDWRETGVAMPEGAIRRGFGSSLIEQALRYQLQAETRLQFEPDGVHCTIALPLDG